MENQYKEAQAQNYHLREYNNALRSRLIEAKIEPPPPPANITNINLLHHAGVPVPMPPSTAVGSGHPRQFPDATFRATLLRRSRRAVAQLGEGQGQYETKVFKSDGSEDARTADEISRQLGQVDGIQTAHM